MFRHSLATATSTRWPNYTSFAIVLTCLALVFGIAQFTAILALGVKLLQLPSKASCFTNDAEKGWVPKDMEFPLVIARMGESGDAQERFGMGPNNYDL